MSGGDTSIRPPEQPIRIEYTPCDCGTPLRVESVCLPFVFVRSPAGTHSTLDVRRTELTRLPNDYAKTVCATLVKAGIPLAPAAVPISMPDASSPASPETDAQESRESTKPCCPACGSLMQRVAAEDRTSWRIVMHGPCRPGWYTDACSSVPESHVRPLRLRAATSPRASQLRCSCVSADGRPTHAGSCSHPGA